MARLTNRPLLDTAPDRKLLVARREFDELEQAVLGGVNALLLGERGSGKSSALNHLARLLRARDGLDVVEIQGSIARDARDLLTLIAVRLETRAEADWKPTPAEPGDEDAASFLELLSRIGRALPRKGQTIVLLDGVPSAAVTHTIFGRFRDEIWTLTIQWVVSGDLVDRATLLAPPADAFFERVITLAPLDRAASFALLRRRLEPEEASDELIEELVDEGRGNPRRLIGLAREALVGERSQSARLRRQREALLVYLSEPGRRLLEELEARGSASASDEGLLARLDWKRPFTTQVFGELERLGLVEGAQERLTEAGRPRKVYSLRTTDAWSEYAAERAVGEVIEGEILALGRDHASVLVAPGVVGQIGLDEFSEDGDARPDRTLKRGQAVRAKIISLEPEQALLALSLRRLRPEERELEEGD